MYASLEIARTYKALKLLADLQGPICYKDPQSKGINRIVVRYNRVKFAYHFHINYDLNWKPQNFLHWVFAILVKLCVQGKALMRTMCSREMIDQYVIYAIC